ncbi:hypothetical protein OHU34_03310 [Streptomyces sp. NBC_00080]|uniref:hypothetical protein n=1 Tax=Streptomyces sp. NBC_00080 TaxID=2975645 RepID=UPI00324790C6
MTSSRKQSATVSTHADVCDRLAPPALAQCRMASTEQAHRTTTPGVPIEQTRRRLAKLRAEGRVDRITLPQPRRSRHCRCVGGMARRGSQLPTVRDGGAALFATSQDTVGSTNQP